MLEVCAIQLALISLVLKIVTIIPGFAAFGIRHVSTFPVSVSVSVVVLSAMDPFHAKLVAAATGSTMTALTSMLYHTALPAMLTVPPQ